MTSRITIALSEEEQEGVEFLEKETMRPPIYVFKWLLKEKLAEVGFYAMRSARTRRGQIKYETSIEAEINASIARHDMMIQQAREVWPEIAPNPKVLMIKSMADIVTLRSDDPLIEPEKVRMVEVGVLRMGYSKSHETILISPDAQGSAQDGT